MRRQHQYRRGGVPLVQFRDELDAGAAVQRKIGHDEIRLQLLERSERGIGIGAVAYDFEIGLDLQQRTQTFPQDRMILDEQYPDTRSVQLDP